MERLQSAIAKARATRAERGNAPPSSPFSTPSPAHPRARHADPDQPIPPIAPDPTDEPAVEEAWNALPRFSPAAKVLTSHRIVTTQKGTGHKGVGAIEFDKLRTRIVQQMQARGWTRLAITSPGAGCGKSTIALNLGYSLTRQAFTRIVICEMDLRRPSLAQLIGAPRKHDFIRVLNDRASFSDHAVRLRDNFAIAMAQGPVPDSAELLQTNRTGEIIADIQARYEPSMMMFDMPPFQVSDDVISFVDKVDCVLIVAAAEATTVAQVDQCERELAERTNVLGVVLNKCRFVPPEDSYDYYG